jgi:hypothetical protein
MRVFSKAQQAQQDRTGQVSGWAGQGRVSPLELTAEQAAGWRERRLPA